MTLQKPLQASAAINREINFQGKLVNTDGTNIPNGTYNMEFKIYSGGDGIVGGGDETLLWTEDHLVGGTPVTVTDGVFQVNLGALTTLPGSVDFNNSTLWLSMNLGDTSSCTISTSFTADCSGDGEMSPMVRFTAAPYAFNSDLLDGLDSGAFGQLAQNQTWTGTQTLQPTSNVTSAVVKQTSAASPTADIFNVQTANGTNVIQITGPAANEAAVTISSVGATRALTLDSASGTLVLGSNTTTLQKSGTAFTFDLNNGSNSTLTITNAGAGVASLSVEGDITTTANAYANNFDRTAGGILGIGNGNATSTSICNSANCDAVTIGTNTDADTITIGDSSDTIGINGTTTVTGATTLAGTTLINNSGTSNTTIGNSAGGTITIGASSGSDLALNDAQWSVTGAGVANFASVGAGSGTITTSGTIGTAGTTTFTGGGATFTTLSATGATTINTSGTANTNIGNSAGGTISIGAASGSDLALQDAQWGVTGAGAATFASVGAGSGTITTTGTIGTASTTTFTGAGATFTSVDSGSGTIQTTGSVFGNTIDRSSAGTLSIGTTGASNATAITLGRTGITTTNSGALTVAQLLTGQAGATIAGTTLINNSGSSNTTIGNSGGGTITIGAASGSDLALQDAQWGVTGAGAATFASVGAGSGTITTTGTIGTASTTTFTGAGATFTSVDSGSGTIQTTGNVLGNNFDRSSTGSVSLGDLNASSVSICNTANCDTVNIATNTDADTINIGDSNDTINLGGQITGAGLANCKNGNDKVTYDSTAKTFSCGSLNVRSFVDTTADSVVDANTTDYWDNATENNNSHPNITPSSTSASIFGIVSTEATATSNTDVEVSWRAERNVGSNPTCNSSTQVGGNGGTFSTNTNAVKSSTFSFIDSPSTTSTVYYTECSDAATNGTGANITRIRFSLFELTNSNADLAEVYPTNDTTLHPAEVVSLDPNLTNGVQRTDKTYDSSLFGVVSTNPAMVIGGTDGLGKNGVAVALSGRVPVNVNTENGEIHKGDILTASSSPGVAMKATKAGGMLGVAMEDYDGSGVGQIMVYVKTGDYNGSNLADIMKSSGYNISDQSSLNISALNYFMGKNQQTTTDNTLNLSEIFTDRVAAGLEIITPKVTTDKLVTNNIEAATGKDVSIKLAEGGNLVLSNAAGDHVVTFGSDGSAKFNGSVSTALDLSAGGNLFAGGGLTVGGTANFQGETLFQKFVSFVDKVVFKKDVTFEGRATFNSDTGGFATIHKTQDRVKVNFDNPYDTPPVVTVNIKNGKFVKYSYKDLDKDGFTIVLQDPATEDIEFSWTALDITLPHTTDVPLPPENSQTN